MALREMYPMGASKTTQITEDISASAQAIPVSDIDFFPAPPNYATIGVENDAETVIYTGKDEAANTLIGCLRGQSGTVSNAWSEGSQIYHSLTSELMGNVVGNITDLSSGVLDGLELDDGSLLKWDDANKQIVRAIDGVDYWSSNTLPPLPMEEGAWVPQSSGGIISKVNSARYYKIGGLCACSCDISIKASTGTGRTTFTGLPFPQSPAGVYKAGFMGYYSSYSNLGVLINSNLVSITSNGGYLDLNNVKTVGQWIFGFVYTTA